MSKNIIITYPEGLNQKSVEMSFKTGQVFLNVKDNSKDIIVSDGSHTFEELYNHRITLFITLCKILYQYNIKKVWRSKSHNDGSKYDGWFIMGITAYDGRQITYHLPEERWDETWFATTLDKAPEWDGHTSYDVLERLKNL